MQLASHEKLLKEWESSVKERDNVGAVVTKYTLRVTNFRLVWEKRKAVLVDDEDVNYSEQNTARQEIMLPSIKGFTCGAMEKEERIITRKSNGASLFFGIALLILGCLLIFATGSEVALKLFGIMAVIFAIVLLLHKGKEETVSQAKGHTLYIYTEPIKAVNVCGEGYKNIPDDGIVKICIAQEYMEEIMEVLGALLVENHGHKALTNM